jgi:hypothetical protein
MTSIKYFVMYKISLQVTGEPVGEVRAVSDMHQRKAEMARQADAFIALPGKNLICRLRPSLGLTYLVSFHVKFAYCDAKCMHIWTYVKVLEFDFCQCQGDMGH